MIVNARMYSATPAAKQAWKDVLSWATRRAGLAWQAIDYDAPAPLSGLWARPDLGCAMMCGLPYSRRRPRPVLIAAPVPAPARYAGRPVYFTDIVVKASAPFNRLEDTFGGVVGYTLNDSMSGCVALRHHLARYRQAPDKPLYREAVGGFVNARSVIEALINGRIDVGPLDSYYHDLLKAGEPEFAADVRVIATTGAAPIPPLVATAAIPAAEVAALRSALGAAGSAPELAASRALLLLKGFAVPDVADYDIISAMPEAAEQNPILW
jgi:ABC-type phosphate/phosphonate transport system substrate-binding protein